MKDIEYFNLLQLEFTEYNLHNNFEFSITIEYCISIALSLLILKQSYLNRQFYCHYLIRRPGTRAMEFSNQTNTII